MLYGEAPAAGGEEVYAQRAKLYRLGVGEWTEKGLGQARLRRDERTQLVRFSFCQEETFRVLADHALSGAGAGAGAQVGRLCRLQLKPGSDKCFVWAAEDIADGQPHVDQFALKFKTAELAALFREAFEQALAGNSAREAAAALQAAPPQEALGGVEEEVYSQRSRLYRFCGNQWQDHGPGRARLLRRAETRRVRFVFFPDSASNCAADHAIVAAAPFCDLRAKSPGEKCWVWTAEDCADGKPTVRQFALKFSSSELAAAFRAAFECARALASAAGVAGLGAQAEALQHCEYGPPYSTAFEEDGAEEEGEEVEEFYSQRGRLFRLWEGVWEERGTGEARLLRQAGAAVARFLLQQESTGKLLADFPVSGSYPLCRLRPNAGSAKSWVWTALDHSTGEQRLERFALKFATEALAQAFYEAFEGARRAAGDDFDAENPEAEARGAPAPSAAGTYYARPAQWLGDSPTACG